MSQLTVERVTGAALEEALPDVARLRVSVFRDWPYLYAGTIEYEQGYMRRFAASAGAVIVVARDGRDVVGVATGAPLGEHTAEFVPLFAAAGYDPARVFYFGESVLLATYRGRGIGHHFFDQREAHARAAGAADQPYLWTAFCGVVRPADDARAPPGYRPLDAFWQKRGYRRAEGLVGAYSWTEIGMTAETSKPMQFWVRPLEPKAA